VGKWRGDTYWEECDSIPWENIIRDVKLLLGMQKKPELGWDNRLLSVVKDQTTTLTNKKDNKYLVRTFRSRINSAQLTSTGPRIFKLRSNNFNALTNE